jgi:hypothetical protein
MPFSLKHKRREFCADSKNAGKSFQTISVSISWKTLEIHSGVILFAYLQEELKEENLDVYFSFKKHCEKYENRDKIFTVHH